MPQFPSYADATALAAADTWLIHQGGVTKEVAGSVAKTYLGGDANLVFALSDETTSLTAGAAKVTVRTPFALTLTGVKASLTTASSAGIVTVDINENGVSVLSTKLTIDVSEKTSTTAAVPAVISDPGLADDVELTFDIDAAGTGATGLKVWLYGIRTP